MWRAQPARATVIGIALVMFAVSACAPVAYLLFASLGDAQAAYATVLLDARQRGLLYNTTLLGIGSALFATAVGVPLGIALARVPLGGKALIRLALAAPALLPPYVVGLAWVYLGSSRGILQAFTGQDLLSTWTYSLPGAVLVLGIVFYPLSMLATELAMRQIDSRLEEAALIDAPVHSVMRRITLPLAAPSILATALVIFVLAVSEFGVPGLLRVRVYTTEVFTAFAALYDFTRATLLSLPLLVLAGAVATAAAMLLRERLVTTRRRTGLAPLELGAWRGMARTAMFGVVVVALGLPTAILLGEALGARSMAAALAGSSRAVMNSLELSAAGATVVVAVAIWLGYARARAGGRVGRAADIVLVVLFAVPSTIVGVGLIGIWNRPGLPGIAYATDAMFLLAYLARFLPIAVLILAASTRYVPTSHEEAAAVSGAGWLRTMARIVLPQNRLGIATAWVITFVLAFGELGVSILVAPPGESTLPIRIYTIIANTPASNVASLALLQALVILAPLGVLAAAASRPEKR
jgi:ABC-type Fe3+ transport system permease subunit